VGQHQLQQLKLKGYALYQIKMNINRLTPGITISIPVHNHFILPNIYTSILALHGIIVIDHSEMSLPNKPILSHKTLNKGIYVEI